MSNLWTETGARHDIDYGNGEIGHWHEPDYPSCVVCRMRGLELILQEIAGFLVLDPPSDGFLARKLREIGPRIESALYD